VAHLPVTELPASQTRGMKGEAFRAHSHLSERSESSKGVSRHMKGVTVQVAHLPATELPASRTRRIKGEALRAHSHLSERSESSQGVSRRIKGVTEQAALYASLQPCTVQPRTLPARTINRRLGCTPSNSTLLI